MHSKREEAEVRLSQNSRLPNNAYLATGMLAFVCCVLGFVMPPQGKLIDLFFPGVALLSFAMAKLAERLSARDFAILYGDRFEDPALGGSSRVVHWSKVESLRWVSGSKTLIVKTKEVETPLGFFTMSMEDLNADDRLTFIRYVRQAAKGVTQERWPDFCRRVAVPLAERIDCRARDDHAGHARPKTLRERIVHGGIEFFASHQFFAGLLMPIYFLLTLPLLVSRKMAWTIAATVAASCAINIRLVWGAWIEPGTAIVFGAAASFAVLGIFSLPRDDEGVDTRTRSSAFLILAYLLVVLIGLPFAANALAKGWLPQDMAWVFRLLAPALLLTPFVLTPWIQGKRDERSEAEIESEAQAAWDERERRLGHKCEVSQE